MHFFERPSVGFRRSAIFKFCGRKYFIHTSSLAFPSADCVSLFSFVRWWWWSARLYSPNLVDRTKSVIDTSTPCTLLGYICARTPLQHRRNESTDDGLMTCLTKIGLMSATERDMESVSIHYTIPSAWFSTWAILSFVKRTSVSCFSWFETIKRLVCFRPLSYPLVIVCW